MDKVKIGIPRGIPYYYFGNFWKNFFKKCDIDWVLSPETSKEIVDMGSRIAPDEMCLSMKIYLGHIAYLEKQCNYLLIPRIDRFDKQNQTCTNFLSFYDLANHFFKTPILNYNIDTEHDLLDGVLEIGKKLHIPKYKIYDAYDYAKEIEDKMKKERNKRQEKMLEKGGKKVLIVSHAYNIHDDFIGSSILKLLQDYQVEVLFSDYFLEEKTNALASQLSKDLYWKYSRDSIGAIPLCSQVDGIVFVSTFPCGLDSLVHELAIRKIEKPYLNIIIDDLSSITGLETRIESFVDLLEQS